MSHRNRNIGLAARILPFALMPLLFLLVVFFYRKITLTNLILVDYDLLTYFYPYKDAAAAAIREGRLPLWNPYLFTGVPFLANPQTALFYPLNLPGYLLGAPVAVKYSIVFHVFLAGVFTYAFGRASLGLGRIGALVSALCFMFGGFLTQQVGHINQLNAAVWLPLVLLLFDLAWQRKQLLFALGGGVVLAFQILAGHSQETFLLVVGFGLYFVFRLGQQVLRARAAGSSQSGAELVEQRIGAIHEPPSSKLANPEGRGVVAPTIRASSDGRSLAVWTVVASAIMVGLALGLSAIQLLPTFELSQQSIRGGGLTFKEAVSFSLPPWLLARSLLPSFTDSPFSEYIAYSGVLPLLLAAYGVAGRKYRRLALFWVGLALLSLFLALGGYNPLYETIYKLAPPLRLFRVPARWLFLYSFAIAVLAGIGAHRLLRETTNLGAIRKIVSTFLWLAVPLGTVFVIQRAATQLKDGVSPGVFSAWVALVIIGVLLIRAVPSLPGKRVASCVLVACIGAELFFAGSFLSTRMTTAPQAYDSLRPTVAQLLQDPGLYRILSIPRTDFDPGDTSELKSIFGPYLSSDDLYQLLVATKLTETMSPNMPMKYGLATLDGYDGGVLPLRRYVDFKDVLLDGVPQRQSTSGKPNQADALLRDQLAAIPNTGLLGLLNVKYIVIDKQTDLWVDNTYYDLSTPAYATPETPFVAAGLPEFAATAIGLVYRIDGPIAPSERLAELTFQDRSGRLVRQTIAADQARALPQDRTYYVKLDLGGPAGYPQEIAIRYLGQAGRLEIRGMALMDGRISASETLTPDSHLRLVHSGDLKVYQNLDWQPRATFRANAVWARDDQEALQLIRERGDRLVLDGPAPAGLPAEALSALPGGSDGKADILAYRAEYALVSTEAPAPGYLLLTDSFYPGWRAYVDGQETPVIRAEYLFRAVYVPAGSHQVEFRYEPGSIRWGAILSLASLGIMVLVAVLWITVFARKRVTSPDAEPNPQR